MTRPMPGTWRWAIQAPVWASNSAATHVDAATPALVQAPVPAAGGGAGLSNAVGRGSATR